ncbi:hypothetical protein J3458_009101 [Metarhizium acridum]|uniref:uncharacterized protein n=1 Tax=Metarhizium acridum TaxID=92637 RepID=UPI001C6B7EDC|nr:hypothetical protein J3458_009101 [Metarhizium acridum]
MAEATPYPVFGTQTRTNACIHGLAARRMNYYAEEAARQNPMFELSIPIHNNLACQCVVMHPPSERMTKNVHGKTVQRAPMQARYASIERHLRSTESPALAPALTRPLLGMMPGMKQPLVGTWCCTGSNGQPSETPCDASHRLSGGRHRHGP